MPTIHYKNKDYFIEESETLLDGLLRNKIDYPNSCKSGTCQSCLTKLVSGQVDQESQQGLKETLIAQNYFLACQCKTKLDLVIDLPENSATSLIAEVVGLSMLNHNVLQLKLIIDDYNQFKAGQYINLITHNNLIRSYSIANLPQKDEYLELHIKLIEHGLMSSWLTHNTKVGSTFYIRGPMGNCFYYNPSQKSYPIVLAGTGTGLAPLVGIALDAISNQHKGDIFLIHGGINEMDLYLHEKLTELEKNHINFYYKPCVLEKSSSVNQASIENLILQTLKFVDHKDITVFICGPQETTKKIKMKVFLSGIPSSAIYSDEFISAHRL